MNLFIVFTLLLIQTNAFTVEVAGGKEECFYEELNKGQHVAIYFQVVEGSDIDFKMTGPNNNVFSEYRKQQSGVVDKEVSTKGMYKICLDNKKKNG